MLTLALPAQEKGSLYLAALPRRMWKGFSIGESVVHRPWISPDNSNNAGHQGFLLLLGFWNSTV